MKRSGSGWLIWIGIVSCSLMGCRHTADTKMQLGVPLEVSRGYCLADTKFKQNGQEVNRDDTLNRLATYKDSRPYVAQGHAFAVGSIAAAVTATVTLVLAALAKQKSMQVSDEATTGLIAGGLAVGALSWGLCITSESKYATAAETYSARVTKSERSPEDERLYETPDSSH